MMTFPGEAVAASRVLVVGDVMLDRYWFGDVDRISPEAPVPVVRVARREDRLGGNTIDLAKPIAIQHDVADHQYFRCARALYRKAHYLISSRRRG